jgi:hypothetical protein
MVCDMDCFHCKNLRIGWQLVIPGVIDFHDKSFTCNDQDIVRKLLMLIQFHGLVFLT